MLLLCVFKSKWEGTHLIPLSKKPNHFSLCTVCNTITCTGDGRGNYSVFLLLFPSSWYLRKLSMLCLIFRAQILGAKE